MKINNHIVKALNSGEFTKAYRSVDDPDIVYLLTSINDNVKEIYTHTNDHKHIPYMASLGETYHCGWRNLWESRYYEKLTAQNKEAWAIAKILRETWQKVQGQAFFENPSRYRNKDNWYEICYNFIDELQHDDRIPESITHALDYIYTWATAFGSNFLFEFPTRNLKVDNNGDLILLDVVYFR